MDEEKINNFLKELEKEKRLPNNLKLLSRFINEITFAGGELTIDNYIKFLINNGVV